VLYCTAHSLAIYILVSSPILFLISFNLSETRDSHNVQDLVRLRVQRQQWQWLQLRHGDPAEHGVLHCSPERRRWCLYPATRTAAL
ncbi:hypothetical protein BO99DRAFT_439263, partial [Aspergillus violaceofuscus CBS 115571]